jgi:hypothetical protein
LLQHVVAHVAKEQRLFCSLRTSKIASAEARSLGSSSTRSEGL